MGFRNISLTESTFCQIPCPENIVYIEKDMKNNLKKLVKDTEVKLTESILKWKIKRSGENMPNKKVLEHNSRLIAEQANRILSGKAKKFLNDVKKAYNESKKREDT